MMLPRIAAVYLVLLCSIARPALAADWPCFLGPTHDGMAPDTGINKDWNNKPPKTLWTVQLTDDGHAGPSVAAGKVFIIDHRGQDDVVRALDFATGRELWSTPYPEATQNRYGFTQSTPLWVDGKLYTFSRLAKANCFDAESGKLLWSRDTLTEFSGRRQEWDYAASPAIVDGKIIVYPGGPNAAVVALDALTGKTVWQGVGDSKASYSTPVITTLNGKTQIIAFLAEGLVGIDPANGNRLWNFPWHVDHYQNSATPIIRGNTIFITTAWKKGGGLIDLTGNQPKPIWLSTQTQSRFCTPVVCNGRIYTGQDPNSLVCLEAQTGKLLWEKTGFEFPSTVGVDGCVIVFEGKSGDLILLDAQTPEFKELGRFRPLSGPRCWTAPIIADGRMLVRNTKSLVCIDLRPQ